MTSNFDLQKVGDHEISVTPTAYIVQHMTKARNQFLPRNLTRWRYAIWSPCCGRSSLEGPHLFNKNATKTIVCNRCAAEWTFVLDSVRSQAIAAVAARTGQHHSDMLPLREMADQVAYVFVPADQRAPASFDIVTDLERTYQAPKQIPDLSGDAMVALAGDFFETEPVIVAEIVEPVAPFLPNEITNEPLTTEQEANALVGKMTYRDLQKLAKSLGLPAGGKGPALLARIESEASPKQILEALPLNG